MAKSQQTFSKKEREKKRQKRKQDKMERRERRKQEKEERGKLTLEEQFAYVDEHGNLSDTPPDPNKKIKIKVEDISLEAGPGVSDLVDPIRTGKVKFFNHDKGYGFITDKITKDSIFAHINNAYPDIKENQKVEFRMEMGPKGKVAMDIKPLNA